MTGGPPTPSRHPSSPHPPCLPASHWNAPTATRQSRLTSPFPCLRCPGPRLRPRSLRLPHFPFLLTQEALAAGRLAQELHKYFLSAERLGAVRPRRPRALVWPALPLKCDVCIRSHFEPQPGLVEGDTCGRAPPLGFWDPQGRVWGPPRVESQPRGSGCRQSPGTSRPGLCGQQGHGGRQDWPQPSSRARARRAAPRGLTEPPP